MFTKTIDPHFENDGRRKLLTGFDGALTDESGIVLHSMEYPSYSQAERALDALTHELLVDAAERGMVDTLPACDPPNEPSPLGDDEGDTCPDEYRCACGATATLIVRCNGDHPVCHECYQRQFEDNYEEYRGWEVDPIDYYTSKAVAETSQIPLLVDVAHVLGMVLSNGHVSDVIPELRRVNARVQSAIGAL